MKTKQFATVILFSCVTLFASHEAQAFYNPSTGRWLSRDPIEEGGGKNLHIFVSNNPQSTTDKLGMADWVYSEANPTGSWHVKMADIDHPDHGTIHGFRSQYVPSVTPACPCKTKNIIVVQAVQNLIVGTRMDNVDAVYTKYQHKKGTPFRDYYEFVPAWVLRTRGNPLEIVDAPLRGGNEKDDFTWSLEDCAVCRRVLKDGTTVDQVLGCITYEFVRHQSGTAELNPGGNVHSAAAKSPGSLWKKALEHWKGWTDN